MISFYQSAHSSVMAVQVMHSRSRDASHKEWTARDADVLRGWRSDIDAASLSPCKRARVAATTKLFEELRIGVLVAISDRQDRDDEERAKSKALSEQYPLIFPDACPPAPTTPIRGTPAPYSTPTRAESERQSCARKVEPSRPES